MQLELRLHLFPPLLIQFRLKTSGQLPILGTENSLQFQELHLPVLACSATSAQMCPVMIAQVVSPGEGLVTVGNLAAVRFKGAVNCLDVTTQVLWSCKLLVTGMYPAVLYHGAVVTALLGCVGV
jgi:hypothetical protein